MKVNRSKAGIKVDKRLIQRSAASSSAIETNEASDSLEARMAGKRRFPQLHLAR